MDPLSPVTFTFRQIRYTVRASFCLFRFLMNQKSPIFMKLLALSIPEYGDFHTRPCALMVRAISRHPPSSLAWLRVVMGSGEKNAWFLKEFVRDFFFKPGPGSLS